LEAELVFSTASIATTTMSMARSSRMLHYIGYRMRITLQDSRCVVGTFMAFDRHMNMVRNGARTPLFPSRGVLL